MEKVPSLNAVGWYVVSRVLDGSDIASVNPSSDHDEDDDGLTLALFMDMSLQKGW